MKSMISINDRSWKDFYLTDFFHDDKGNQNNMSSLISGDTPLVSAKKCDNGYKDFVESNGKKLFPNDIITLNNDGDGGAGIAYYQPHKIALDSHVTALIPRSPLSRYQLLFVAMCITKQRNKYGHGYSINSNRLRSFKIMLPISNHDGQPDWQFMGAYMRQKEQEILKYTIDKLCKQLIVNELRGGGVTYPILSGKRFISLMFSPRYNVVNVSKKPIMKMGKPLMFRQHHLITGSMVLLEMKVA